MTLRQRAGCFRRGSTRCRSRRSHERSVVSEPIDVLADVSGSSPEASIEVDERHLQALCDQRSDSALAGSAWTDQRDRNALSAVR
jgi:hypothetical protein